MLVGRLILEALRDHREDLSINATNHRVANLQHAQLDTERVSIFIYARISSASLIQAIAARAHHDFLRSLDTGFGNRALQSAPHDMKNFLTKHLPH